MHVGGTLVGSFTLMYFNLVRDILVGSVDSVGSIASSVVDQFLL
jgi:hypothetical protein